MSFSKLPADIGYEIAGHVVAEYIDTAITAPPRPIWIAPYNKDLTKYVLSVISERHGGLGPPAQLSGTDWTEWSGVTVQEFHAVLLALAHAELGTTNQASTQSSSTQPSSTSKGGSGSHTLNLQTENSDASDATVDDTINNDSDLALDIDSDGQYSSDSDYTESDVDDFGDDSDDDSDIDDDELRECFERWELCERLEALPANPIGPLLAVNTSVRNATLKVVRHALGLQPCQGKNFFQEIEAVLKVLRKGYRIALTPPFAYTSDFIPEYKGPQTPMIDAYIFLSEASYAQRVTREFCLSGVAPADVFEVFLEMKRETNYLALGISPAFLRDRLLRRAHIYNRRFRACFGVMKYCIGISGALSQVCEKMDPVVVNVEHCADLRKAIHDLKVFDDKYMDKEFFSLLPRPLIKNLKIRACLRVVAELTSEDSEEEYREYDDLMVAAREASALLDIYRARCASAKTLFVILK